MAQYEKKESTKRRTQQLLEEANRMREKGWTTGAICDRLSRRFGLNFTTTVRKLLDNKYKFV